LAPCCCSRHLFHARKQFEILREISPSLQLGLNSVGAVVAESAAKTLKYYGRFKKEIDSYLEKMTPEMRRSPTAYKYAHDVVVGEHHGKRLMANGVTCHEHGVAEAELLLLAHGDKVHHVGDGAHDA
jgi:hypothetical protein